MFESRSDALDHRDAVFEAFTEEFGTDQPMQISPILDGAELKVADLDPEEVQRAMEAAGFRVTAIGEDTDGDWNGFRILP